MGFPSTGLYTPPAGGGPVSVDYVGWQFCSPSLTGSCTSVGSRTLSGAVPTLRTVVVKINQQALDLSLGSRLVRLEFYSPPAGTNGIVINNMFMGAGATSGPVWNFDSTPTRVTFGGFNSKSSIGESTFITDPITFSIDSTKPFMISWEMAVNSQFDFYNPASSTTSPNAGSTTYFNSYFKASVSEAGTVSKSTFYTTASGRIDLLRRIFITT